MASDAATTRQHVFPSDQNGRVNWIRTKMCIGPMSIPVQQALIATLAIAGPMCVQCSNEAYEMAGDLFDHQQEEYGNGKEAEIHQSGQLHECRETCEMILGLFPKTPLSYKAQTFLNGLK